MKNVEISEYSDLAALSKLFDPASYLGPSGEMVDRVLRKREQQIKAGR